MSRHSYHNHQDTTDTFSMYSHAHTKNHTYTHKHTYTLTATTRIHSTIMEKQSPNVECQL